MSKSVNASRTKRCTKCGRAKPVSEFHKRSRNSRYLRSHCRDCSKAARREHYRRTHPKPEPSPPATAKRCRLCRRIKPLDEFHRNASKRDGRTDECIDCRRRDTREKRASKTRARTAKRLRAFLKLLKEETREKTREYLESQHVCAVIGCNEPGIVHHLNYADPEFVIYLCRKHHFQLHQAFRVLYRIARQMGMDIDLLEADMFLETASGTCTSSQGGEPAPEDGCRASPTRNSPRTFSIL